MTDLSRDLVDRVRPLVERHAIRTPTVACPALAERIGRPVVLKLESLQRTGSFKLRGAVAAIGSLDDAAKARGVVAVSAGNHGQGVALACRAFGVRATVVVPRTAPDVKKRGIAALGGDAVELVEHADDFDDAEAFARELCARTGRTWVSPYDDPHVMAGGGTVGMEVMEDARGVDCFVVPAGGGGLACGIAAAVGDAADVVGVNTDACPALAESLARGAAIERWVGARTIADGIEGGVSQRAFDVARRLLHSVLVVREATIREAIAFAARALGLVVEGSAAAAIAPLLEGRPLPGDGAVCVVLTGRNIDGSVLRDLLGAS